MLKTKIGIFTPYLHYGGAEVSALRLAHGFAARPAYQVDLIAGSTVSKVQPLIGEGIQLIDLQASRIRSQVRPLCGYLKAQKPDVLIAHQTPSNIIAYIAKLLSGEKTRLLMVEHSIPTDELSFRGPIDHFIKRLLRVIYPRADHLIAVSQAVKQDLHRILPQSTPIHVAYNPVITELPCEKSLGQDMILAVGRLEAVKRFDLLLEAFAQIAAEIPHQLVICGAGPCLQELQQLAKRLHLTDRVDFAGHVENMAAYYSRASLHVVASRAESFSNTVVEALAYGVPIVTTRCGGPEEILEEGRHGIVVEKATPADLAKGLQQGLRAAWDSEQLRCRAREFTVSQSVAAYSQLL